MIPDNRPHDDNVGAVYLFHLYRDIICLQPLPLATTDLRSTSTSRRNYLSRRNLPTSGYITHQAAQRDTGHRADTHFGPTIGQKMSKYYTDYQKSGFDG